MAMRRLTVLLLSGVLAMLPLANAQAQTTGGIRGQVLDKDGQPLPTARVTISNPSLGVSQQVIADAKGEFRVAPLPPGKGYSVTVEFPSMGKITVPDVEVAANRMVSVPITLRPSKEMVETIRVTGQTDVVNTESTSTQTTIGSEFIDALPILGRNYQDVLTLAPGTSDVDGDGNINIHGARDVDVVTLVDGVSTVDPVTGQVGQQLNINSIQEIEVKTSGATAEFSRAQGGFITIITKSGGNDFEGSFRFDWQGSALDGDGAGIDDPRLHGGLGESGLRDLDFNDYYPQLTLSGPIKKDKAWYFVAAEYRQEQTPVNALTQAFVREVDQARIFGKVSWDISTNHKLVFSATFDPQTFYNLGLNSFTAIEAGFTNELGGRNLVLRETAVFSPNVFLDSTLADFSTDVEVYPTLNPDTNGNAILATDLNGDGFYDATETDHGEDLDSDLAWDVFEDVNRDRILQADLEDRDRDGRLTLTGRGCEGVSREDTDCDGRPDKIDEDLNGNGVRDPGEVDIDNDGFLDRNTDDRNDNNTIDDRPFLFPDDPNRDENKNLNWLYPYGRQYPTPADRQYTADQRTLRLEGPFNQTFWGERGRQTLKEDLTIFVPDWHGQHELKTGLVVEKEHFDQTTEQRPFVFPNAAPPTTGNTFIPTVAVVLPAEILVDNTAEAFTAGIYVQDTYKPLPNLTLNIGVRFDRETTDSFGYTSFDPREQRALFDRLNAYSGGELNKPDDVIGNNDGIAQGGYCLDAMVNTVLAPACGQVQIAGAAADTLIDIQRTLNRVKISRLTQHHTSTTIAAEALVTLFPDAKTTDPITGETVIDRQLLQEQGGVTFQEEEAFRLTNNNLAPRLAISWDPWADSKTKIFATWSRFYDKLFLGTVTPEEGPDNISRYYEKDQDGIGGNGIPNGGFGRAISKAPPTATQIDRGLQTPYSDEWTVGFEREIAPEVSLRLSYIQRNGRDGLQDRDINHDVRYDAEGKFLDANGNLLVPSNGSAAVRSGDSIPDLYIHNFFFNQIFRLGNFNTSEYKGVEMVISKRLSRKWQMDASYTYARAQGFAEDFRSALGDDPATIDYEYGYLDFDQRHVIRLNGSVILPGDWTIGGIMTWSSGLPYSVITTSFSLDNFDYGQNRTLFGQTGSDLSNPDEPEIRFFGENRNSRRNASILNIDLQATKAFVMGPFNSKLFLTVEDALNTDDLDIITYEPDNPNRAGNLQLNAERQFGRRYGIGFQFEF